MEFLHFGRIDLAVSEMASIAREPGEDGGEKDLRSGGGAGTLPEDEGGGEAG